MDESAVTDKLAFTGLFKHNSIKTILNKAKNTTHLGVSATDQTTVEPKDHSEGLFDEPVVPQEIIPVPKLFLNVVQCQWAQPGTLAMPSNNDKKLYTVDSALEDLLKLPQVDPSVQALTSSSVLPPDLLEGLKAEDEV